MACRSGFGSCNCLGEQGSWEFACTFSLGTDHYFVPVVKSGHLNCVDLSWTQLQAEDRRIDKLFGGTNDENAPTVDRMPGVLKISRSPLPFSYLFRESYVQLSRPIVAGSSVVLSIERAGFGEMPAEVVFPTPGVGGALAVSRQGYDASNHRIYAGIYDQFVPESEGPLGYLEAKEWNSIAIPGPTPFSGDTVQTAPIAVGGRTSAMRMWKPILLLGVGGIHNGFGVGAGPASAYAPNTPNSFPLSVALQSGFDVDENGIVVNYENARTVAGVAAPGWRSYRRTIGPSTLRVRGTVFES